jgi:hypothetical protein
MSKRSYKPAVQSPVASEGNSILPINDPIAVYYRQSTEGQIGNVSTVIQTVDMVKYLKERGWSDQNIILIDMDAGVSGTKKIDERPGMSYLFSLITEQKIRAVACQDEDRLFRDVTQIQVNIFIEACRAAHVLVLTPSMVYDFANELTGTFHARQFRFKSEMAAEYINSFIKGKLFRAKQRLHMEGRWSGGGVAVGYMVDLRKTLPDGSKNPRFRLFVPFPPYAEVVNEYYRLFLSNAGNFTATLRHIHAHGPYYPDPAICPVPDGFKTSYQLHRYNNGFCPGKNAFFELLTNAIYIGHWVVNDTVVRRDNHEATVPLDVFTHAYNYLMDVTLDGQPNLHYRPFRPHSRPTLEEERPTQRPLCAGLMVAQWNGQWRNVGPNWDNEYEEYKYVLWSNNAVSQYVWGKNAQSVDEEVSKLLKKKLTLTFETQVWEESLETYTESHQIERKSKLAQLETAERVKANLLASLETVTNQDMIRKIQQRYEDAEIEQQRLVAEIAATDEKANYLQAIQALQRNWKRALETWSQMTHEEKRVAFHAFIKRIEAKQIEKGGLHLTIHWLDNSKDKLTVYRGYGSTSWTPPENSQLLGLIEAGSSQVDICKAFPDRTWRAIYDKLRAGNKHREINSKPTPVKWDETYNQYLNRIYSNTSAKAESGERWATEDIEQLANLLKNHAGELEIAATFPNRKWENIRKKINTIYSGVFYISKSQYLDRRETFYMYQERVQGNSDTLEAVVEDEECGDSISSDDHQLMVEQSDCHRLSVWGVRWR